MRVICINNGPLTERGIKSSAPELTEGEVYTVTGLSATGGYVLKEVTPKQNRSFYVLGWIKDRFIPLSTIDETEMIRETNLQKI